MVEQFRFSRRTGLALLGAALVAGCATGSGGGRWASVPNSGFSRWLTQFRTRAAAAGVPQGVVSRGLAGAGYIPAVIDRDRNQAEFNRTLEDYMAVAVSDSRVQEGRANYARRRATFDAIETRLGVPGPVVCAIWGLESRYGTQRGEVPVISALATLAYDGRRGQFFERQLIAALRIIAAGDVAPGNMRGSWAGAMGHTQFIPTSYLAHAVDFDGDGRRDIWSDDPTDALASGAGYLADNGWTRGRPWGWEVTLPGGYAGPSGRGTRRPVTAWTAAGLRPADGQARSSRGDAALILPDGRTGPAFLVTENFGVILRYNNAVSYGIAIGHLADRIAGGGPIRAAFAPDEWGLRRRDRIALQNGLLRRGYDIGAADGVIGDKTRAAIRAYEAAQGWPTTGQPSQRLLAALT